MERLIAMSICSILLAGEARAQAPATKKAEVDQRLLKLYEAREFQGMPYRLMKPIDLAPETSYPLIVSLHGAAGRGNDNLKNIQAPWISIVARDELRREHPCFVLAPQSDRGWSSADEKEPELTEETIKGYPEALQRFYKRRLAGDGPRRAGGDLTKVFDLIAAIEKEFRIDHSRIYVLGHSMGGMGTWNAIYDRPGNERVKRTHLGAK